MVVKRPGTRYRVDEAAMDQYCSRLAAEQADDACQTVRIELVYNFQSSSDSWCTSRCKLEAAFDQRLRCQ
jgi:hypothetical protein